MRWQSEDACPGAVMKTLLAGRLSRARALPWPAKKRAVHAGVWLLCVGIGLRLVGFARTQRLLERLVSAPRDDPIRLDRERADRDVERDRAAVARAAHLVPFGTCLTRALTLWALLRRRGIETVLKVGVRKHGDALAAHAWLESDGVPIVTPAEVAGYAAFREPLIPRSRKARS
ncbi:MAG: lasso peptide biosynthesis B2 protein [Gammaproteobacteria bacterium]|nr:lasso peptide biosynthesis B2 protein [Gammaproteobacteria bacterium]